MRRFKCSSVIAILSMSIGSAMLADSFIGVASTRGNMSVDHASVRGNANIGPGSTIQTTDSTSQVQLQSGVQLTLSERSSAAVFADRMELKQGSAQVNTRSGYGVEALGFRFTPEPGEAMTQISFAKSNRLMVSALHGPVKVFNGEGILLAKLSPGTAYFVEDEADPKSARGAGQQTPAKNSGKTSARKAVQFGRSAKIWTTVLTVGGAGASIGAVVANASK